MVCGRPDKAAEPRERTIQAERLVDKSVDGNESKWHEIVLNIFGSPDLRTTATLFH